MHEEETASFLACHVLRCWLDARLLHVAILAFVSDFKNHGVILDYRSEANTLVLAVPVTAKNRVGQRFRKRHGNIQRAFLRGKIELATLLCRELHYLFDVFDVAGNFDIESDAGLGHQKLSS